MGSNNRNRSAEIQDNIYTLLDPSSETNLVAYYNFDMFAGNILPDEKGGTFHGELLNMEDEDWVPVDYYLYSGEAPDTPINVVTSVSGTDLIIDWDTSAGATSYDVYSSDDPYGTFTLTTNVSTNQYTVSMSQAKLFYYVIAKN